MQCMHEDENLGALIAKHEKAYAESSQPSEHGMEAEDEIPPLPPALIHLACHLLQMGKTHDLTKPEATVHVEQLCTTFWEKWWQQ